MATAESNILGAKDAQTQFSQLLARVEAGEEFTITKYGSPIARLVPVRAVRSAEARQHAMDAMRQLASRNRLDGLTIKDLVSEGRR